MTFQCFFSYDIEMPFERLLKELVENINAKGAILLDWEGESVVHYGKIDDYDLKVMGAYQVIILNHFKNLRNVDEVNFFQMKFGSSVIQFLPINKDYYVFLYFEGSEIAPRAYHNLRKVVDIFAREIA